MGGQGSTRPASKQGRVPFFHSLQAKYALTYLLVVAAILIVMNTYPLLMAENMVFTSKESSLKRQALVIGSALAVSETLTREGVEQTMASLIGNHTGPAVGKHTPPPSARSSERPRPHRGRYCPSRCRYASRSTDLQRLQQK